MFYFLLIWSILSLVFLFVSSNLLFSLIVLEILGFLVLFFFGYTFMFFFLSEYYLLIFFSLFVMEGVLGLCGLVILVFYSGTDYISFSSLLRL